MKVFGSEQFISWSRFITIVFSETQIYAITPLRIIVHYAFMYIHVYTLIPLKSCRVVHIISATSGI